MGNNNIFCIDVNQLGEFAIVGGTTETLQFYFFDENNQPLDLTGSSGKWRMAPLGQPNHPVAEIDGEINGENCLIIVLDGTFTENLSGKFIHQPIITAVNGKEYVYQQGVITIIPKIQGN